MDGREKRGREKGGQSPCIDFARGVVVDGAWSQSPFFACYLEKVGQAPCINFARGVVVDGAWSQSLSVAPLFSFSTES